MKGPVKLRTDYLNLRRVYGPHRVQGLGSIYLNRNYGSKGYMNPILGFTWSPRNANPLNSLRFVQQPPQKSEF